MASIDIKTIIPIAGPACSFLTEWWEKLLEVISEYIQLSAKFNGIKQVLRIREADFIEEMMQNYRLNGE